MLTSFGLGNHRGIVAQTDSMETLTRPPMPVVAVTARSPR